jgi:DNA-binding NarL/FixJ family response regulator
MIYLPGYGKYKVQSTEERDRAPGCKETTRSSISRRERKQEGYSPMGVYTNSGVSSDSQVKLTKREVEVLSLVIEGKSSKEVADQLYVSKRTVDFHLANIYSKLSVTNRLQAFREATRRGLLAYPGSGNPQ